MTAARSRRGSAAATILGLAIAAAVASVGARFEPAPLSVDQRIDFYAARLGGSSTYPAYAGLGLAYLQRAEVTGSADDLDQARRYLVESQQRQPNLDALKGLAAVLLARHEFAEARAAAREAADTDSRDPETVAALFDAVLAAGEPDEAAALLDTLRRQGTRFAVETRLANLEEYRGRLPEARSAMLRACEAADAAHLPASTRAWCRVRLGSTLVSACDAQGAERLYRQALALVPGYFLAREHLAELMASQNRLADAAREYDGLLHTHPNPAYSLALAEVLRESGDDASAAALDDSATRALRASAASGSRADWRALALLLVEDETTVAEGLRWAERDWENRRDVFAADTLAWALFQHGRWEEASFVMGRALEAGTRVPIILLHAAEIARAQGQPQERGISLQRLPPCRAALSPGEQRWALRLGHALE